MTSVFVAAIFATLFGAIFCFTGYRFFLVMLPIWGFFAGFWLGTAGVELLFGSGFLASVTSWITGFVLGLVAALLSYLFYMFGVAIVAAAFGSALGSGLMLGMGFDPGFLVAVVSFVFALVVAGMTLLLNIQKYVIIAITAIGGANLLVLGPLLFLDRVSLENLQTVGGAVRPVLQDSWFWLLVWLVLAIVGFLVQFRTNRAYTFTREQYVEGWG